MCKYPSFFGFFLGHSVTVGFAKLIFTSLIQISVINPESKHYVTLAYFGLFMFCHEISQLFVTILVQNTELSQLNHGKYSEGYHDLSVCL